jgi:dCTP deaminase
MSRELGNLFPELDKDLKSYTAAYTTGILPYQDIVNLIAGGRVTAETPIDDAQIQPASLDLRLGATAWRVRASFLPGKTSTATAKIERMMMHRIDLSQPTVFERGCVYIAEIMEALRLPSDIYGKSNPKSSTGRLDIFTRLFTEGGTEFESVPEGYRGNLYLEIVPRTFSVLVKQGARLNQLRFVRGSPPPSDHKIDELNAADTLVYADGSHAHGGGIVGYRAKQHAPLIDLSRINHYDPLEFWDPLRSDAHRSLVLNPDDFYILMSRERVRIPPNFAASMVPYDPSMGEFRIHYAGFFDPGFGYGNNDINGARAVLEVRSHEVPFLIEHGQGVGRLIYERLLSRPERIYGVNIGSNYQAQGLKLSKQFKPLGTA